MEAAKTNQRSLTAVFNTIVIIMLAFIIGMIGCRSEPDPPKPKVESLSFTKESVQMKVGERLSVAVTIKPDEVRKHTTVEYNASVEEALIISEQSNDGCVIEAVKGGTVVLVAKAGEFTSYLEVNVEFEEIVAVPYIVVPTQVVELNEGSRKSLQVSLYNGTPLDNGGFQWRTEENKNNITIMPTGNTVVVQGEKRGSQKIIVSHEKSDYEAEILVFVLGVDEEVKYISTGQNVLPMTAGAENTQIHATLVNGSETDNAGFIFSLVEGEEIISVLSSNNTCSVSPLKAGTGIIRITHPLAEYALDVRVIVKSGTLNYIEIDKQFIMMGIGEHESVIAQLGIEGETGWQSRFSYELSDPAIVNIDHINNQFIINPLTSGNCVITITHEDIQYSREVLVMVRKPGEIPPDEYYITTSQNVMQLEIGQQDVRLYMQLINGVEADKNGFEWVVDNTSLIEVTTPHGTVRERSVINSVFNAEANITVKKVGITRIEVSHPKSPSSAVVIVKVYPRGTFAGTPFIVGNLDGQSSLIKIDTTKQAAVMKKLRMLSGDALDVGSLEWSTANSNIATTQTVTGLENEITGKNTGVTRLSVNNDNLKYSYEATITVNMTDTVLYADTVHQTVAVGQNVSVEIKDSEDSLQSDGRNSYKVSGFDTNLVSATMIGNRLLLQGIEPGSTIVSVSNEKGFNLPLEIQVDIVPSEITILKPYTLKGDNFIRLLYEESKNISVSLQDATPAEKDRVRWGVAENDYFTLTGNGETASVTAKNKTGQMNIKVSHDKSMNEKTIVMYVLDPHNPDAIVLGIEKNNWMLKPGSEQVLHLITNATAMPVTNPGAALKDIQWESSNAGVVSIEYNGDKGIMRAVSDGNAVIKVTHPKQVIELQIYVSVSSTPPMERVITLPSIIELLTNENIVVTANTQGLDNNEITNIRYSIDDPLVASISGDGANLYIKGLSDGQAWITARQTDINYEKKILLTCGNDYSYVLNSPESYYRMRTGEQKTINLEYGLRGFPEEYRKQIVWEAEANKVVNVHGDGLSAQVVAHDIGIAKVKVRCPGILKKDVEITFDIYRDEVTGTFSYDAIVGVVIGTSTKKELSVSINPATLGYISITYYDERTKDQNEVQNGYQSIIKVDNTGNLFVIEGLREGQTYLRVEHPLVKEPARILVYTARTQEALDKMFPLALPKQHYVVVAGGEAQIIQLETPDLGSVVKNNEKLDLITWGLSPMGIVDYVPYSPEGSGISNKKAMKIVGKSAGNCVFDINYPGQPRQQAYVSVVPAHKFDPTKRMITESIIGMYAGQSGRQVEVAHNLTTEEVGKLEWKSQDESIVKVSVTGNEASALFEAIGTGETYVVVSLGQIERYIKVYVTGTDAQIAQYKAINIDNRYYQIRRNDELTLSAFHAALLCTRADEWKLYPVDNNVIAIMPVDGSNGSKVQIKGLNEGLATIYLSNIETNNYANTSGMDVRIIIEVSDTAPLIVPDSEDWFLTTVKTVYAVDHRDTTALTRLSVNPVRFTDQEAANIKWTVKSDTRQQAEGKQTLRMYSNSGTAIDIQPNIDKQKGTVVFEVTHGRSSNSLSITVICDAEAVQEETMPYITASLETVKVEIAQEAQVNLGIAHLSGYDTGGFTATADNTKIEVTVTGNILTVKGKEFGQSLITIQHKAAGLIAKKIVALVTNGEEHLVYLTTSQNFVVIEKDNYKTVDVQLAGYDEHNNSNFEWYLDNPADSSIVSLDASGKTAVISGKGTGTAKIKVRYKLAPEYPLDIYVRVTQAADYKPVYITTNNNIVSVKEGNSMQVKSNLVNGLANELSNFVWSTLNTDIIELHGSGDTGMVKGLKPGSASVTLTHPSSLNSLTIIVVVEPDETKESMYIATDSLLIEMATTETQRQVRARLVGGNDEDMYGLVWQVTNYASVQKDSNEGNYQVVNIVSNGDTCYITPNKVGSMIIEGEAVVSVTHPKTRYRLDIKVVVSDSTQVAFSKKTITITRGHQEVVDISGPSSRTLFYSATGSKENVVQVAGTSSKCIIDAREVGTAVVTAFTAGGTKSDEIVVNVVAAPAAETKYIHIENTVVLLNTNNPTGLPVRAEVRSSSSGAVLTNETNAITFTSQNTTIAKVIGASRGQATIQPTTVGETQVMVKNGNLTKVIYVKVTMDDANFLVSDTAVSLLVGSPAKEVWAKVNNAKTVNYGQKGDITMESKNPQVAVVAWYSRGDEADKLTNQSNWKITAMNPGQTDIEVWYKKGRAGQASRTISVVVAEVNILTVSTPSLIVYPNITHEFEVYVKPKEKIGFSYEGPDNVIQISSPDVPKEVDLFGSDGVEVKADGKLKIQVVGTQVAGSTNLVVHGMKSNLYARCTINNTKNYKVRWIDKQTIRSGTTFIAGKDNFTITYDIVPAERCIIPVSLTNDDMNGTLTWTAGDSSLLGSGYYTCSLFDLHIYKSNPRQLIFKPKRAGYTELTFGSSDYWGGNEDSLSTRISLPIYFHDDKVQFAWGVRNVGNNHNSHTPHAAFDSTQSALYLDDNGWIELEVTSPDVNYLNRIGFELLPVDNNSDLKEIIMLKNLDNGVMFSTKGMSLIQHEQNNLPDEKVSVDYKGIIKVKYRYWTGKEEKEEFEKIFMLYTEQYRRKK